jgi:hypothetical protein
MAEDSDKDALSINSLFAKGAIGFIIWFLITAS